MADDKVCPSCGHCPTCGRGPQVVKFIFPSQPWYVPTPIPWWQTGPYTVGGGGITTTGTGYNTASALAGSTTGANYGG